MARTPISLKGQLAPKNRFQERVPRVTLTTGIYEFYQLNPFTMAYHHAVLAGQLLALMMATANLFNDGVPCLLGFSLGSVFAYSTCCTLFDLGCRNKIGDVCLLGSCVDLMSFGQNIHKLIGSKGVIQGKLTVVYTVHDSVLAYLFKSARLGETPIGLKRISPEFLMSCMRENDPGLAGYSQSQLATYLDMKFECIDVSRQVSGHLDYPNKLTDILPSIDFNSDFQFFKERT